MEKWAEWLLIGITLVGSLIAYLRSQQQVEDLTKSLSGDLQEISKSIHDLTSNVQGIKVEIAEIKTEMRNRNSHIDERHRDTEIALDELRGDTKRHGSQIQDLKEWRAGADVHLKERTRGAGD